MVFWGVVFIGNDFDKLLFQNSWSISFLRVMCFENSFLSRFSKCVRVFYFIYCDVEMSYFAILILRIIDLISFYWEFRGECDLPRTLNENEKMAPSPDSEWGKSSNGHDAST